MRNIPSACLLTVICIVISVCGCTSTEDPSGDIPPAPTELSGTIGAAGGTLTSSNGLLSISIPPGALTVDTGISLGEIGLSEIDPAFGDVTALGALELLPADLPLSLPAQVTYSMSISAASAAVETKLPAEDLPEEAKFIIGVVRSSLEGVRVPDQKTDYNLKAGAETNVTTTVDVEKGGQIIYAGPLERMQSLGQFATILGPDDLEPTFMGIPKKYVAEITLPGITSLELGDTYFKKDPEAGDLTTEMADGAPWISHDTTILDNGMIRCPFYIDMVPQLEGDLTVGAVLGGSIIWFDPDQCGVYLGEIPDIGDLEFTIQMPTYEQFVEAWVVLDLTIETGMTGLQDLAVAFGTVGDPAPLGEQYYRWLYLAGAEGIQYYRLVEDEGQIMSTQLIGSIAGMNYQGVVPVSTGTSPDIKRELFIYGSQAWKTSWNDLAGEYGMMGLTSGDPVYDAIGYGGETYTPGLSYGRGFGAYFLEYDSVADMYTHPQYPGGPLIGYLFPGDGGNIISCYVHGYSLGALIIKDGLPGEIWYHSRYDIEEEGTLVGITGNEPKQLRGAGSFFAISNYISNTLTTFTWNGMGSISNVTTTPVGLGPQGIDVMLLGDGTPLVVSTDMEGHYTLSHFGITGNLIKKVTYDVPSTCTGPRHAIFIGQDPWIYVALSCHDSGTVELVLVRMQDL